MRIILSIICIYSVNFCFSQDNFERPYNVLPISLELTNNPNNEDLNVSITRSEITSINNLIASGISHLWSRAPNTGRNQYIIEYAMSKGMYFDFMTNGFEMFDRYNTPSISVYSPDYYNEIEKLVLNGLSRICIVKNTSSIFPFQDEPFHAGPHMFDFSEFAQNEFLRQFGYPLPLNVDSAMQHPKKWIDLLNFQSNTFRDGWKQVYKAVKAFNPGLNIIMTHDSHNVFGAGVNSNSKVAIDDVFHWGGEFADIFVYDIYPYMTFDYRYGEFGKLPRPRISQMHYTIAQMRNLTSEYKKELGFWVGTYNKNWFNRFWGLERKNAVWAEQEMAFTATAHGSNFLMIPTHYDGSNIPIDSMHWEGFRKASSTIAKAGSGLCKAYKVKANACFLFPRTQHLQLQEEYFNVGLSFELCLRAFGELDIIHEEQVTEGKLDRYKILILCDVKLLPEETAKEIVHFVNNGGVVIADCVPQLNAYKERLSQMTKLFGVSSAETYRTLQQGQWVPFAAIPQKMSFPPPEGQEIPPVVSDKANGEAFAKQFDFTVISPRKCTISDGNILFSMESGEPGLITKKSGKGKTYLLGFCLQDTYFNTFKNNYTISREGLMKFVESIFQDTGVNTHIKSSNPGIEATLRANSKEGYLFVINHEENNPIASVIINELDFTPSHFADIETGKPVNFTKSGSGIQLEFQVPFGTSRLIKFD